MRNDRGRAGAIVGGVVGKRERATYISVSHELKDGLFKRNAIGDGINLVVDQELGLSDAVNGKVPSGLLLNTTIEVADTNGACITLGSGAVVVGAVLAGGNGTRNMRHNVLRRTSNVAIFGPHFEITTRDFIEKGRHQRTSSVSNIEAVDVVLELPDLREDGSIESCGNAEGVTKEHVDVETVGSGVGHVDAIGTSTKTAENKAGFINDGFAEGGNLLSTGRRGIGLVSVKIGTSSIPLLTVLVVINCHRKVG